MKKTMNEVIQIKYEEKLFSPEIMDIVNSWYVEFNEGEILSYNKKYKSRKREDIIKIDVPSKEMKNFFIEIYKFVRTADYNSELIDDCSHKVTIIYAYDHKEIIEGCPMKGEEQMLTLIYRFLEKHGINQF